MPRIEMVCKAGGAVWLLYLGSLNFVRGADPFADALKIPPGEMAEPRPGILKLL